MVVEQDLYKNVLLDLSIQETGRVSVAGIDYSQLVCEFEQLDWVVLY